MPKPRGVSQVGSTVRVNIMVVGVPGIGKTRFAGTSGRRTLIIRPPTDHTDSIPKGAADELVVADWTDLSEAQDMLRHEGAKWWDWVWLDSVSLAQDFGLDNVYDDNVARSPNQAVRKMYGADKGDYGVNMFRLGRWFRHLIMANQFHVGVTAHPFETEDADGNAVMMPWIQGRNMPQKICGYMNMVGYMRDRKITAGTKTIVRKEMVFKSVSRNQAAALYAKDQFHAFPNGVLIDPTVPKLMAAVAQARANRPTAARRPTSKGSSA